MDFNSRQRSAYSGIFSTYDVFIGDSIGGSSYLDQNNIFDRLCVVDISDNDIEVPTFMRGIVEDTLRNKPSAKKIVYSLYSNCRNSIRKTADSIIIDFFINTNTSTKLMKVVTNSGDVYYGMKGLILDAQFKPLMFATMTLNKDTATYTKITVYIHPEVFLNTGGLIHKAIIKKLIPFYSSYSGNLYISSRRPFGIVNGQLEPQVIIADASRKFLQTPVRPSPESCNDEHLNQLLVDNIDDVLNQLVWE